MKKLTILLLMVLFAHCPSIALAGTAKLTWDNPTTYMDGTPFNETTHWKTSTVYYGTVTGVYPNKVDVGKVKTFTVNFPPEMPSTKYFFVVTVTATNGIESDYSNEASKVILPPKPSGCSLTVE